MVNIGVYPSAPHLVGSKLARGPGYRAMVPVQRGPDEASVFDDTEPIPRVHRLGNQYQRSLFSSRMGKEPGQYRGSGSNREMGRDTEPSNLRIEDVNYPVFAET